MSPLELAAMSLWQMDQPAEPITPSMVTPNSPDWQRYLEKARGVIAIIREPSERMIAAGDEEIFRYVDASATDGKPDTDDVWRAMIDAILEDSRVV